MAKSRTNSLHERLPIELRAEVDRDLVEQPPGRETYEKVYAHYGLAEHGVGIKSLERWGAYLRKLAIDRKIGRLADAIVGRDLGPDIRGVIRARVYEAVVNGDATMSELLKASMAEANVTKSAIAEDEWQRKVSEVESELAKAEKAEDPGKALANLSDRIREIYGLAPLSGNHT